MTRLALLLPFALLAAPALAHAETSVDVKVDVDVHEDGAPAPASSVPEDNPLLGHRWEAGLAFELAPMSLPAGDLVGTAGGATVTFARQLGHLRLGAEYGFSKVSARRDLYTADGWWDGWEDVGGEMQRFGATVRFRAATSVDAGDLSSAAGGYVELGLGREQLRWNGGGSLDRDDLEAGLGVETAMAGQRHMGGIDVGVKFLATAAGDGTHDVAVLMHLGALFGW